jgi:predicted AAA+ superfamily ATPase
MDSDKLFEIISDWNYWFKEIPDTYSRLHYEEQIALKSSSKEVVVIKGIRRSGKSTLLVNEIKRLHSKGTSLNNILFVNFEDQRFNLFDKTTLLEDIKQTYLEYIKPSGDVVMMFDEVQNVPSWEKWILKEYELTNNSLYVTGSNSHLLGKEFGTSLSGRYLAVEVLPLSFDEYLSFKDISFNTKALFVHNKLKIQQAFNEYLKFGGFPWVVIQEDERLKKDTLKNYYDSILLKDIVARYHLKNYQLLNELSLFLLSNNATINSYNKLKNNFGTSFDTIKDYLEYLLNAYMIFSIDKFDYSYKKQVANPKKIYAIDVGFSNNVSFNISQKIGQNLENIVFLSLKQQYEDIFYYKTTNGFEVDFLIRKDDKFKLFQVSQTLKNDDTLKRELRVFKQAKKELNKTPKVECFVITMDDSQTLEFDGEKIEAINILEFLLRNRI